MTGRGLLLFLGPAAMVLAAAGVAFLAGAVVLGFTALGVVAVCGILAGFEWHRLRTEARETAAETTIDLRDPGPRIATHDPVTGLIDRVFLRVVLTQRVATARRHLQPLSLVLFELDGFERARAERRDQAMRLLGSVLGRTLRECDSACRFGDASVAVLLEDTPESGAAGAAERVRRTLAQSPSGGTLTLSAGIACYPSHALDAHDLLRRSVRALGSARAAGRDRVEIAGGD